MVALERALASSIPAAINFLALALSIPSIAVSEASPVNPLALGMGGTGLIGDTGEIGPMGETGDTGETGPIGDTGETGDIGAMGDTGEIGDTGEMGDIGEIGDTGEMGEMGDIGEIGDTGETGVIGVMGVIGVTGVIGVIGVIGVTGVTGVIGPLLSTVKATLAGLSAVPAGVVTEKLRGPTAASELMVISTVSFAAVTAMILAFMPSP